MSGTGVQSAMRRRTRPPDDPRKSSSNSQPSPRQYQPGLTQQQQQRQQTAINPGQILYMHQAKIREIEKTLENLGVAPSSVDIDSKLTEVKTSLESTIDKRLSVISNNLNFVLNGLNEERLKTKRLEATIEQFTARFATLDKLIEERIESRIDRLELKTQEPEQVKEPDEQVEQVKEPDEQVEQVEEVEQVKEQAVEQVEQLELEVVETQNKEGVNIMIDAATLKSLATLDIQEK